MSEDRRDPRDFPDNDAVECEPCAAKSGAPTLCAPCIHNRDLVARLLDRVQRLEGVLKHTERRIDILIDTLGRQSQ